MREVSSVPDDKELQIFHSPLPPSWNFACYESAAARDYESNWLRLLGSTKTPQIDQGVGHQLHAVVAPLDALETQQQSLEFVLPRKRPFHAIS